MKQIQQGPNTNLFILSAERQYSDSREDRQSGEETDENSQDPDLKNILKYVHVDSDHFYIAC
jgi:hypothetical protein